MNIAKTDKRAASSVFISYARADDQEFVAELYQHLRDEGFKVWWDKVSMPSRALTFLQEIRDAIETHDRMLVILGPKAIKSEYVRAEWQYALAADKVVIPLLRIGGYEIVPPELGSLHCEDVSKASDQQKIYRKIIELLDSPLPKIGRTYHVPKPPPHYQPRPDQYSLIAKKILLKEPERVALAAEKRITVLYGMGGLGKSVTAAAIARAISTRRLFFDGVIWLNFGRIEKSGLQTQVLDQLRRVGQALGDDIRKYTASDATESLKKKLEEAAVLLVLDNIWWDEQVHPFRTALGRRCNMIITARDANLADRLGVENCSLDLLSDQDSLALLADWLGKKVEHLPPIANDLVSKCGRLPFALSIAGAMLENDRTPWEDLIEALNEADLEFMKVAFPDYEYSDLLRVQQVSLEMLRQSGDAAQVTAANYYMQLGALRWDEPVSEAALLTRWGLDAALKERQARSILKILADKVLLRTEGEAPNRLVYLHDLQHDFLVAHVQNWQAEHENIIRSYVQRYPNAPFVDDDDGYYLQNYFHHLVQAGRKDEIHQLLRIETQSAQNAWWNTRIRFGQASGFEADLRLALEDAKAKALKVPASPSVDALALIIRYLLMLSSVRNSLTEVPVSLIKLFLTHNIWTVSQALAAINWKTGEASKSNGFISIISFLDGNQKQTIIEDALAIARRSIEDGDYTRHLLELCPYLSGELRTSILQEALGRSRKDIPRNRIHHLVDAYKIDPTRHEWIDEAFDLLTQQKQADNTGDNDDAALISPPTLNLLGDNPYISAYDLKIIYPYLSREKQTSLLEFARKRLREPGDRAAILIMAAKYSPEPDSHELANEAYEGLLSTENINIRIPGQANCVRFLPPNKQTNAAELIFNEISSLPKLSRFILGAIMNLMPFLSSLQKIKAEKQIHQYLIELSSSSEIQEILSENELGIWLAQSEPILFRTMVQTLIMRLNQEEDSYSRARSIEFVKPFVSELELKIILKEENYRAQIIDDLNSRVLCTLAICKKLDLELRSKTIQGLLDMISHYREKMFGFWETQDLFRLASQSQLEAYCENNPSYNEDQHINSGLAIAFAHQGEWEKVSELLKNVNTISGFEFIFEDFPESVPEDLAKWIIERSISERDPELAGIISILVQYLPEELRDVAIDYGIQAVEALSNPYKGHKILQRLIPICSCERLKDIFSLLENEELEEASEYAETIVLFSTRLADCGYFQGAIRLLSEKLEYADDFAKAYIQIVLRMEEAQRKEHLEEAERYLDSPNIPSTTKIELLLAISKKAEDQERLRLRDKAMAIAENIINEKTGSWVTESSLKEDQARAFLLLAPEFSGPRRTVLLLEAWRNAPKNDGINQVLNALSPLLSTLPKESLLIPWYKDLEAASASRSAVYDQLAALMDVVQSLGGMEILPLIIETVEDVAKWWPDHMLTEVE